MTATATERVLLDEEALQRTLRRIAHEIVEKHPDLSALGLVGIYTRGATLAQRLRDLIEEYTGTRVPTGAAAGGQIAKGILHALHRGFYTLNGMRDTAAARMSPTSRGATGVGLGHPIELAPFIGCPLGLC